MGTRERINMYTFIIDKYIPENIWNIQDLRTNIRISSRQQSIMPGDQTLANKIHKQVL